jgi:DNA-binding protein HU-beta
MDSEKEVPETDTPEKTSITEGVSNLVGATVSSIAESVKAVASTITDRIKSTTPDPDQVESAPEVVEPEAARTDEQLMLSGDVAIAPEAVVPAPVVPKKRAATKKLNKRAAKTSRKAAAKKASKKASKNKGRTMAKKSKKKSVTKSVAGAAKKVVKKAKKAVKKVTKKSKR